MMIIKYIFIINLFCLQKIKCFFINLLQYLMYCNLLYMAHAIVFFHLTYYCQSRLTLSQSSINGLSMLSIIYSPQYKQSAARIFSISFLICSRCVALAVVAPIKLSVSGCKRAPIPPALTVVNCCFNVLKRRTSSLPK